MSPGDDELLPPEDNIAAAYPPDGPHSLDAMGVNTAHLGEDDDSHLPYALDAPGGAGYDASNAEEGRLGPLGPLYTFVNLRGTVAATAFMSGRIHEIELDARVTTMSEGELAGEVLGVAHVAKVKARANFHEFVVVALLESGMDEKAAREFAINALSLPAPETAAAIEAEFVGRSTNNDI